MPRCDFFIAPLAANELVIATKLKTRHKMIIFLIQKHNTRLSFIVNTITNTVILDKKVGR